MTRAKEKLTLTNARQRMLFGRTTPNAPSRFLSEVPEEDADWQGKTQPTYGVEREYGGDFGGGWGDTAYAPRGGSPYVSAARDGGGYYGNRKAKAPVSSAAQKKPPAAALPDLKPGDRVKHKSFGAGMVTSVTPMGGDQLLEIAFDGVGTKKLLLKFAGPLLEKV